MAAHETLALLAEAAGTRFELAATEAALGRIELVRQLVLGATAVLCAVLALLLLLVLALLLAPESTRPAIVGAAAALVLAAAAGCHWRLRLARRRRRPFMQATLQVLRSDIQALWPRGEAR